MSLKQHKSSRESPKVGIMGLLVARLLINSHHESALGVFSG